MTLQDMIAELKAAGANKNTLLLAMNCHRLGKADAEEYLRNWSLLAARALDDAHRVLETIEPESTTEAEGLTELRARICELFIQALVLNGLQCRQDLQSVPMLVAAKH